MDTELTPVLFRAERSGPFKGDVSAVFPTIPGAPGFMSCYAHIGQHSSCGIEWYRRTRPATPDEYKELQRELEAAPYGYRLKVVSRITPAHRSERLAEERREPM